jgi:hypothetical protein
MIAHVFRRCINSLITSMKMVNVARIRVGSLRYLCLNVSFRVVEVS